VKDADLHFAVELATLGALLTPPQATRETDVASRAAPPRRTRDAWRIDKVCIGKNSSWKSAKQR